MEDGINLSKRKKVEGHLLHSAIMDNRAALRQSVGRRTLTEDSVDSNGAMVVIVSQSATMDSIPTNIAKHIC